MRFFLLLLSLVSFHALAVDPTLRSQSGGKCYYDDGSVISSYTCPTRLRLNTGKTENPYKINGMTEDSKEWRRKFGQQRNEGLQQGMSAIQFSIEKRLIELAQEKASINRLAETVTNKSERQMMQVLSEYPDALEVMREPAFLKWVISSLKYQNMYIKARLQENPNPWSLEHLLLSYQFVKLEENTSFVKWLESLDKNEVDPAIMAVNDLGHFKPLKKLLKKWSAFDSI